MKKYKKILAGILAFVLVVSGIYFGNVDGSSVLAADTTEIVENSDYISIPYNQVNMETEIPTTDSEEYEDWIFAGWFTGEGCSKESALAETDKPDENCYAKFLPKEVLDVKVQTMDAYIQEGEVIAPNGAIRFVSSVDSLNYQYAGFHITYPDGTVKEHNIYKVLKKIDSNVMNMDKDKKVTYEFSPKIIDTKSEYFMTAKLAVDSKDSDYVVKAFYKTLDGTIVYGESRCVSVNDGKSDTALSLSFINVSDIEIKKDDLIEVTYGNGGTGTASVVGVDGQTVHVRITLKDAVKGDLPSATKFTFGTYGSAIYRNLYTMYNGNNADTTWYDVYDAEGATEFIVATDADFYGMASVVNSGDTLEGKTVYIAKDIDANADDAMDWSNGTVNDGKTAYPWTPIGTATNYFKGCFDGDGHVISGIYLIATTSTGEGMFGRVIDAVIKNFELQNSYHTGSGMVSAIAGDGDGTLAHIKCADSVYINSSSYIVGGMFCRVNADTISGDNTVKNAGTYLYMNDCWFDGTINVDYTGGENVRVGSMVGFKSHGSAIVENCLFSGKIDATLTNTSTTNNRNNYVGGLFGTQNGSGFGSLVLKDSISAGCVVAKTFTTGGKTATVKAGVVYGNGAATLTCSNVYGVKDQDNINCTNARGDASSIPTGVTLSDAVADVTVDGLSKALYWKNRIDAVPVLKYFEDRDSIENAYEWLYESAGDLRDAYLISNITELNLFNALANESGWTFDGNAVALANSITVNKGTVDKNFVDDTETNEKTWTPIGNTTTPFKGTFDGAGHSLSGLYVNATEQNAGLFGYTVDCTVKNLYLLNSYFTTTQYNLGSISGSGDGTFENIYSEVDLDSTERYVGGIIGYVSDGGKATTNILIDNCWYNGTITQSFPKYAYAGGIVGFVYHGYVYKGEGSTDNDYSNKIINSLFTGHINAKYDGQGGNTNGQVKAGGICGGISTASSGKYAELLISNCVSNGTIADPDITDFTRLSSVIGEAGGSKSSANNAAYVTTLQNVYANDSYGLKIAGDLTDTQIANWAATETIDFADADVLKKAWSALNGSEGNTWTLNVDAEEAYKLVLSEFCAEVGLSQPQKMAWANYDADMAYESGQGGLAIYLPTEKGYINYNFVHTVDEGKNADMWRLSVANLCDNDGNLIKQITKEGAEWEMAIRLTDVSDFIGGYAHGDEKIVADTTPALLFDGEAIDITSVKNKQFYTLSIEMDSEGFDPADGTTKVLEHHKEYTITKAGISLDQTVTWCADRTLHSTIGSYLAMMPPMKHANDDDTDIITDYYYTDKDSTPVYIGGEEKLNEKIANQEVTSVCVYGQESGIYFTLSKGDGDQSFIDEMLLSENYSSSKPRFNYNKMYFVFALGSEVATGDVWTANTNYNIEWK